MGTGETTWEKPSRKTLLLQKKRVLLQKKMVQYFFQLTKSDEYQTQCAAYKVKVEKLISENKSLEERARFAEESAETAASNATFDKEHYERLTAKIVEYNQARTTVKGGKQSKVELELEAPNEFQCPISLEVMADPVVIVSGHTYERAAIEKWFNEGHRTCPKSHVWVENTTTVPNHTLRTMIQDFESKKKKGDDELV